MIACTRIFSTGDISIARRKGRRHQSDSNPLKIPSRSGRLRDVVWKYFSIHDAIRWPMVSFASPVLTNLRPLRTRTHPGPCWEQYRIFQQMVVDRSSCNMPKPPGPGRKLSYHSIARIKCIPMTRDLMLWSLHCCKEFRGLGNIRSHGQLL